jgi:hypothetical protein
MKIINLLDTRNRIILATLISTIIYFIALEVNFLNLFDIDLIIDPIKPFIVSMVIYISTFWALSYKVNKERLITILMFPSILGLFYTLFIELIITTFIDSNIYYWVTVISLIIFAVILYVTLLTVNILNTAYKTEIPLEQAAKAAHFVITLGISYIAFFIIFSYDFWIIIRIVYIFITVFILVYISLWTLDEKLKNRVFASLLIAISFILIAIVISLWPITTPYITLVMTVYLYMSLGVALESREIISNWIWVEYALLFVLLIFMLLLVAEWGINGTFI